MRIIYISNITAKLFTAVREGYLDLESGKVFSPAYFANAELSIYRRPTND